MFLFLRPEQIQSAEVQLQKSVPEGSDQTLPQTLHDVLHVAGVDVVSLQQAAVAGALHRQLEKAQRRSVSGKAPPRTHGPTSCFRSSSDSPA